MKKQGDIARNFLMDLFFLDRENRAVSSSWIPLGRIMGITIRKVNAQLLRVVSEKAFEA
jgi:hypothetical protein